MKQSNNYLDYVFQRAPDLDWEIEVSNDEDAIADGSRSEYTVFSEIMQGKATLPLHFFI